jgi:hypothetical protein
MTNWFLAGVLGGLRKLRQMEKDKATRAYIQALIEDQETGIQQVGQQIYAAKMIGIRSPAFEGDYIGYPEDDFDNPEMKHFKREDDSEEKDAKK